VVKKVMTDQSQGLDPLFVLKEGAPAWTPPPSLDPSFGNGQNAPYYNGKRAVTPSSELTYAFNIERQLTGDMMVEVGYLGTLAAGIQSALLAYNQIDVSKLPASLSPWTASGRTLLNSLVGSTAANAAGIKAPFKAFNDVWARSASVGQSLRPFPQYGNIDTTNGQGDREGHSTYHSMQVKLNKRYAAGLTLQASYVLSKYLTDSDGGGGQPEDHYNRALEKSIGNYDQTHIVKFNYVYELPFGKGKKYLGGSGVASALLGGWRIGAIQQYQSGTPISLGTTVSFPIFNGGNRPTVATYDGWRGAIAGDKFDPTVDKFFQPVSFFGTQPTDRLGTNTRYNPKLRGWPSYDESISLGRGITIKEDTRLDLRVEAFNLLNRTRFGGLSNAGTLQNANFGLYRTQSNTPRRMQVSLKLYW